MTRHSILDEDTDRIQRLAELLAEGIKRDDIAEVFGVHRDTISEWRKRADVQQLMSKIIDDRAKRILSHTDTRIVKKLEEGSTIPMRELLEIRRTFAGEKVNLDVAGDRGAAITDLLAAVNADPELAKRLAEQLQSPED